MAVMSEFPIALSHGDIFPVMDDIFAVMGTTEIVHDGVRIQSSRTMTIIREHGELTLVNSIRLNDDGLRKLLELGRIKNVVRLGAFHGRDDAFYQKTFHANLWADPQMTFSRGEVVDRDITVDGAPCEGARFINFTSTRFKESLLLLERSGGVLISCDSIKNWTEKDEFFDDATFAMMEKAGSIGHAKIDSTWLNAMKPSREEIESLSKWSFATLITSHGKPLLANAKHYEHFHRRSGKGTFLKILRR